MIFVFNTQHEGTHLKKSKEIVDLQLPVYNENYLQSLPWKKWLDWRKTLKVIMILNFTKTQIFFWLIKLGNNVFIVCIYSYNCIVIRCI